ncbi:MAG TPA: cation:proton antiporter [bacterium]|nr:cation:proton antiporter [bacterium]HQP96874.1 cation:proton antiporter [bacterium]
MKWKTACLMGILMLGIVQAMPVLAAPEGEAGGHGGEVAVESPMQHFVHVAAHTILQLGVIIILAMIARRLCEAVEQPPVIGALLVGILITNLSKFSSDSIPIWNHIFPVDPASGLVVTEPLWILGGIGAIILLFLVGVEVDFEQVKRVGAKSTWIALGGIVLPFVGATLAMLWFFTEGPIGKPQIATALFMGAVFTATSVGISAKVYSELRMLDTDEGLAVLVAGIVDDVGGLLVLSGVLAYATGGAMSDLLVIGAKALIFLGVIVIGGKMISFNISDFMMKKFGRSSAPVLLTGVALVIAAIAESQFQLAMIVGAAAAGMVISGTRLGHQLEDFLKRPEELLSPVFFVVMGMLVDLSAVTSSVLMMGLVMTVIAIIGKVGGCGIPAKFEGFSNDESLRIGIGMNNRGEVGLIVAGIGYATGNFDPAELAVAIIVILLTTVPTPSILKKLSRQTAHAETAKAITISDISTSLRNFIVVEFLKLAHKRGFSILSSDRETVHEAINEKTNQHISLSHIEDGLVIDASECEPVAREILSAIKEGVSERLSQAK